MTHRNLIPSEVDQFLNRFNNFNDGLIRQILVRFWGGAGRTATIECSTVDTVANEWCNVIFHVHGLRAFKAAEGRTSHIVLSDGVHFAWFGEQCYVDFAPHTSAPTGLEDVERSEFYVVGERVEWELRHYAEFSGGDSG